MTRTDGRQGHSYEGGETVEWKEQIISLAEGIVKPHMAQWVTSSIILAIYCEHRDSRHSSYSHGR